MFSLLAAGFASCNKEITSLSSVPSATIAVAASKAAAINTTSTTGSTDSVYIVQPCSSGSQRDSIAVTDLPVTVTTYLETNYTGYTFNKAFAIKNSSGSITNYVAIIYYNDKPVAILFESNGSFIRVLEQREKADLNGNGWHEGGRFCDRNGLQKDTVAFSA